MSVEGIRAELEAAPPGPWPYDFVYEAVRHIRRNCDFIESGSDPDFNWNDIPDAALIAHAPTYLAALLDVAAAAAAHLVTSDKLAAPETYDREADVAAEGEASSRLANALAALESEI